MRRKRFASLFGRTGAPNFAAKPNYCLRGEPVHCFAKVAKRRNVGSRNVAAGRFALNPIAKMADRQHFASPK